MLENYVKTIGIEARTMEEMVTKDLLPAISDYAAEVSANAFAKKEFLPSLSSASEEALVTKLSDAYTTLTDGVAELKVLAEKAGAMEDAQAAADASHSEVLAKMDELRTTAGEIEALIPDSILPYPTYDQLLFSL